jgi:hypothetical protein
MDEVTSTTDRTSNPFDYVNHPGLGAAGWEGNPPISSGLWLKTWALKKTPRIVARDIDVAGEDMMDLDAWMPMEAYGKKHCGLNEAPPQHIRWFLFFELLDIWTGLLVDESSDSLANIF